MICVLRLIKMAAIITRLTGRRISSRLLYTSAKSMSGEYGTGEGKGGGGGGAVRNAASLLNYIPLTVALVKILLTQRSAGGSFGKMEHAHEEQYFRKQQEAQLKAMKEQQKQMAEIHKREIKHHEDQIKRHKDALADYEKMKRKMEYQLKKDD